MTTLMSVSLQYNASQIGVGAERSNLNRPVILRALATWKFIDKLNDLDVLVVTMLKNDLDLSQIYLERSVTVPAFEFKGIITGLSDINDTMFRITIHEEGWHFSRRIYKIEDAFKEYNISLVNPASLPDLVQGIVTSANSDMPFTWTISEDIPATSDLDFGVKWKSYYQVLKLVALNSLNDLWFEKHVVMMGTKGKTITLDKRDKIYDKLVSEIDLETYGNIVTVVGAKSGGNNLYSTATAAETNLSFNYERVVSNNNLTSQASVDGVKARVLDEVNSINPDVKLDISQDIINKYNMKSGDIIKINSNTQTQTVKGFFRLIEIVIANSKNTVKLQFSKTGVFLPRVSDSLDILNAALIKIHDIELNS